MDRIVSKVRDFIIRHALIEQGDRVLLSLSAGKDSMLMFHILNLLRQELGFMMGVFHLNHQTRGAESDRDEEHLIRLAREHDFPIHIERYDFSANRIRGLSFEEHARAVRYERAEKISAGHGYNKIATAHTRNDHIETILMRIFTGTGIYGLRGIQARRDKIIRPLLALTSDEVYGYLTGLNISWLEDSSNTAISYPRNFIRHNLLPLARTRFSAADESIQSLSELAGDALLVLEELITQQYPSLYEFSDGDLYIEAGVLMRSEPLFSYAVTAGMRKYFNYHANRKMIGEIYAKYRTRRANIKLYRDNAIRADKVYATGRSRLKISEALPLGPDPAEWEYCIDVRDFHGARLCLEEIGISVAVEIVDYAYFEKFVKNNGYIFISMEKNIKSLYIRNRRKGDRMRTEQGMKKIKDLLIEKKLDNDRKERVPLLVADSEVIACMPGLLFDIPNRVSVYFLVDKNAGKVLSVCKN